MNKTDIFIQKAIKIHGDKYDYSKVDYRYTREKVIIICKEHGEFLQTPTCHLRGYNCKKCSGKHNYTTNEYIEKAKEIHGDNYDYSKVEYKNSKSKIKIICKIHGEFQQESNSHLNGHGCPNCGVITSHINSFYSTKEFIEKAVNIHGNTYDYSKVEYKNSNEKVIIVCKEHGEFLQIPSSHLCGKGCKKCSGNYKYTTQEFIEKAEKIYGDKYDYSEVEYKNANEKVIFICKEHGEFLMTPHSHISGQGCPKCGIESRRKKKTFTTQEFIEKSKKIHGDKYDYSKVEYKNSNEKVIIVCKKHGEFLQIPIDHSTGHGCQKCGGNYRYTTEDFIEKAVKIHGDKYDYSRVEYKNIKSKIKIICKIHGEFLQTPHEHLSGCGCSRCCNTGHSKMQINWLNFISLYYGIYIQHAENDGEYSIPGSRYKADGYCLENNTIYEFHGDYWHGNPLLYNQERVTYFGETFGALYEKTKNKENYIEENGYNIKVMWESDWKKINKSIIKFQKLFKNNII
ncbi:DUF723 domain-containing protein [bacterium]|nr:DUF723 domain-containing protein [bacterium]